MHKFGVVTQLAIGIVFMLSSAGKVRHRAEFAEGIAAYRIVPHSWANLTALLVIMLEAFVAVSHLTGYLLEIGLPVGLVLIGSFGIAVGVNLHRERPLPCYCFGASSSIISVGTLARLSVLATGEAFLLIWFRPIQPAALMLPNLAFAMFWSIFVLTLGLWLFSLPDVFKLLRTIKWRT